MTTGAAWRTNPAGVGASVVGMPPGPVGVGVAGRLRTPTAGAGSCSGVLGVGPAIPAGVGVATRVAVDVGVTVAVDVGGVL